MVGLLEMSLGWHPNLCVAGSANANNLSCAVWHTEALGTQAFVVHLGRQPPKQLYLHSPGTCAHNLANHVTKLRGFPKSDRKQWYPHIALICISLIRSKAQYLFLCSRVICISFGLALLTSLPTFLLGIFSVKVLCLFSSFLMIPHPLHLYI